MIRLTAPLFFANSPSVHDHVLRLARAADPRPTAILLDMEASSNLDISSLDMLIGLNAELKSLGIEVFLANVIDLLHESLKHGGVVQALGEDHIALSIEQGVEQFHALHPAHRNPEKGSSFGGGSEEQ